MKNLLIRFIPASLTIAALGLPSAFAQTTERVSVDSLGFQGNQTSHTPSISADGRYVAFQSLATNLVPGDTNGLDDVFVYDRQTGQTTRVSVSSLGVEGNGYGPSISANGRFVAFRSWATNLVPGDTNGVYDVFVHDRQTGQTTRVSVNSIGLQGNDESVNPTISADGRYVAFESGATNLVPGDTSGEFDIFVHDRQTGQTTRVSVSSLGVQGNDGSFFPDISADGLIVAFQSYARNLVPGDTNINPDIFVHDRQTNETTRVSVDSLGVQANDRNFDPGLSADGRYVAFESYATNLFPGDTNATGDVFVHDRLTGQTTCVSVDSLGVQGNRTSYCSRSAISADGRTVAFYSYATNLVPGDTNNAEDLFVHDRQTGQTFRLSVDSLGVQGNDDSYGSAISADGRYVAFESEATNLVSGDTNSTLDVFVHDRGGINLSKIGTCDGQVALAVERATPYGLVTFLYGPAGTYTQASGPCAGLVLGISAPVVGATLVADLAGVISYQFFAPPNLCGVTVQAVDLTTCIASEAVVLEPRVFTLAKNRGCSAFQTRVIDLLITGAVPGSPIALFHGPAGSYVKPGGSCAGTTLGISNPVLIAQVTADLFGDTQYSFSVPPALCGLTVQAVERSGCQVSNTITL